MKKYLVHYGWCNTIISTSRNAAKHLQNLGGEHILVTDLNGNPICAARRDENGTPYSYSVKNDSHD